MVNMKNLSNLANKAKEAVEKRGGTDSLKQDAAELKSIAKGPGSFTDKAKAAADALKRPGEAEQTPPPAETERAAKAETAAKADAPKKAKAQAGPNRAKAQAGPKGEGQRKAASK